MWCYQEWVLHERTRTMGKERCTGVKVAQKLQQNCESVNTGETQSLKDGRALRFRQRVSRDNRGSRLFALRFVKDTKDSLSPPKTASICAIASRSQSAIIAIITAILSRPAKQRRVLISLDTLAPRLAN